MSDASAVSLPEPLDRALDEHLKVLRASIVRRTMALAHEQNDGWARAGDVIGVTHLSRAIEEYAPGHALAPDDSRRGGVWGRLFDSLSPVTTVSALLAIVFAACGLWAARVDASVAAAKGISAASYLDIAKIFAGAIVGSTSAALASSSRATSAAAPGPRPPGRGRR